MAQSGVNVGALWSELNKFGQNQDYEAALKISNKILHELPDDSTAFHCKIVCMIQQDMFENALTAIRKTKIPIDLQFEKAYCEYRLNRTKEALATLRSINNPSLRVKELLAQVLYRLEVYEDCYDVYKDLIKNSADDFEDERQTNMASVMVSLQQKGSAKAVQIREDTYELCYNAACALLSQKKYQEAEGKLRQAENLCRQTLEQDDDPDVTEDDINAELAIIRVQLGYTLQMLGRPDEAMKLYNLVVKQRPSDVGLVAVASNNIVTLNKDQNVFDSKKKIRAATADGLQQKLTSEQRKLISMNQCLLYMYMNQGEQCKQMAQNLEKKYQDTDIPCLILAAQLCREKQVPEAIDLLKKKIDGADENSIIIKFVLAQLYLSQGTCSQACKILESLGPLTSKPGVVSSLVALYLGQEDIESAGTTLDHAVKWYKENDPSSPDLLVLIDECANFHLQNGSPEKATLLLEELRRKNPNDNKVLATLINAYAKFDSHKAQAISRELPSVEELATDIDVDQLESAVSNLGIKYVKRTPKAEQSPAAKPLATPQDELIQKRHKKKKKGKLPKNPDAALDPERWLPRRERSYYRGKRKDKRKDIGKGTQGAAVPTESENAATGGATAASASSPAASGSDVGSPRPGTSPQVPQGPRQQKPTVASSKKKKKKGSKW